MRRPVGILAKAVDGNRVGVMLGRRPFEVRNAAVKELAAGRISGGRRPAATGGGSEVAWAVNSGSAGAI
jgi:hypothetical protein